MEPNEYCIIIMSHGRAENLRTVHTLRKYGCKSEIVILIDDEDSQAKEYFDRYDGKDNCKVIQFCKEKVAKVTDTADLIKDRKAVIFARNHSYSVAESLGYEYFILLEDDYLSFDHRWIEYQGRKAVLRGRACKDLDKVFGALLDYLHDCHRLQCVCLAQAGDFIGGAATFSQFNDTRFRKAMNVFACAIDRPNRWYGRLNDDVNSYIVNGMRGALYITIRDIAMVQELTQIQGEGMTDIYKELGTYAKSFYSVMMCPSSVKVSTIGRVNMRVHHTIDWRHQVPMLISSRYKKSDNHIEPMEAIQ